MRSGYAGARGQAALDHGHERGRSLSEHRVVVVGRVDGRRGPGAVGVQDVAQAAAPVNGQPVEAFARHALQANPGG